jgi:ankyrin repeat protein
MSTKTAPSLDEAASASPANAEDDFDLVDSDLDVLSIPGSQDGVLTPAITTAEGPEHKEELCNSKKSLHRLDYQEFHDAIIHGDFNSVKQMLDDGADIERTAYDGGTPLVIAIYEHHMNIVALLLERGADVKHQVIDASPIFHAVSQKEYAPRIIQLLLDHGADLEDEIWPTRHETACCQNALHWAAEYDAIDAVDFLISKGLDINGTGLEGKTPLIYAAEKGHLAIVKLLLAKGAEIHERSRNGESALMWASSKGQHEVVDYLLNEGASVDDRAKDDTSMLMRPSALVRDN